MEITERDLFNLVFYKDLVDKDKCEFLEEDNSYRDEIEFFNSLKDSLSEEISPKFKKKIAQKIPAYNFSNVIVLYPAVEKKNRQKRKDKLVLAAELKSQHTSQTFSDEKKQYLVKLINSDSNTKIFVFSTSESELKNLKLTLHPKEKEYFLKDNSNPLEVNENVIVESISLEFV